MTQLLFQNLLFLCIKSLYFHLLCLMEKIQKDNGCLAHFIWEYKPASTKDNLDTLEESDDEEEFQNVNLSKYVDLDKRYNMTCVYNHKFKKWVPLEIVKNKKVITDK